MIRHYQKQGWVLNHFEFRIPALLLVNQQIYEESLDTLQRLCFGNKTLEILLEHSNLNPMLKVSESNKLIALGFSGCMRLKAILQSVPLLKIKIMVSESYEEQSLCIALLRWIGLVLNSRSATPAGPLNSLEVIFSLSSTGRQPSFGEGFYEALRGIRVSGGEVEVCFVRPVHKLAEEKLSFQWEWMKESALEFGKHVERGEKSEANALTLMRLLWERLETMAIEKEKEIVRGLSWPACFTRMARRLDEAGAKLVEQSFLR